MKCFKQLKAFKFFKDGHVQKIELCLISEKGQLLLHESGSVTIHASRSRLQNLDFSCERNSESVFSRLQLYSRVREIL